MSDKIRVLIADDHTMVRNSLALFLKHQAGLELVGEAANGEEAIALSDKLKPDIILMDMRMPSMDGITATRAILENHPLVRIIALSSHKDENIVLDALNAGVMSYILKTASLTELIHAITDAMNGRANLSPEATQALILSSREPQIHRDTLNEREQEVLKLMVEGLTNRQIASTMEISVATVKFHVSNILSKLHASSRTEAVALALQHHIIQSNESNDG